MDVDKLKIGITREEARKNLRKVTPDMSEEDIETMIDIVENNDVASFSKIMQEINLKEINTFGYIVQTANLYLVVKI